MTDEANSATQSAKPGRGRPGLTTASVRRLEDARVRASGSVGPAVRRDEVIPAGAKTLIDLDDDECRWPFGHGPFLHCAAPIERCPRDPAARCYCDYHELVRSYGSAAADTIISNRGASNGKASNGKI